MMVMVFVVVVFGIVIIIVIGVMLLGGARWRVRFVMLRMLSRVMLPLVVLAFRAFIVVVIIIVAVVVMVLVGMLGGPFLPCPSAACFFITLDRLRG